jgi:thiamine transport system permease protein
MVLQGWLAIPAERFRLSATLGLSPWAMFRTIEWPLIRRITPGAFAVIFVICLTSFAVALTLGGGPRATTVELAIYQAMRFDFDLGHAAALALLQLGLAILAGLIALRVSHIDGFGTGRDRLVPRWDGRGWTARLGDGLWLLAASAFLLGPLSAMLIKGLPGLLDLQSDTYRAALNSFTVALASTALCMIWAMPLANRRGELLSLASIALSPLVLGTGIFLMLRPFVNPFTMALPVTTLVNALMALPFALRILRPAAEEVDRDYARLRQTLRLSPLAWLRLVWLPRLRRPMGFAAGLTAALAMGDLGVIALFADPDRATLPLQVYRLMGAYRLEAAAGAALLLMLLSLSLFWLFDKGGRVNADP